jgi:hypothetical protein
MYLELLEWTESLLPHPCIHMLQHSSDALGDFKLLMKPKAYKENTTLYLTIC